MYCLFSNSSFADRKKVLKHHPDKKAGAAGATGETNDDAFFKCIQKALEVLSNAERRRQFDSIDPHFVELEQDDPSEKEAKRAVDKSPKQFFELFGPVFAREAHFSKKAPVPPLGGMDDGKEQVEGFYDFWYNFDSWRSFEYLDKEVNEGSDKCVESTPFFSLTLNSACCSRDDKRYTEKKNKTDRARRKKEDIARLRGLVDLALGLDPRIKRIKQEEKDAREAKKKKGGAKAANGDGPSAEEKKKAEEEARKKKEVDDEAVRLVIFGAALISDEVCFPCRRELRRRGRRRRRRRPRKRLGGPPGTTAVRHSEPGACSLTVLRVHGLRSRTCVFLDLEYRPGLSHNIAIACFFSCILLHPESHIHCLYTLFSFHDTKIA